MRIVMNSLFKLIGEDRVLLHERSIVEVECVKFFENLCKQLVLTSTFKSWFPRLVSPKMNLR